eukprot:347048-Chlamydomonas_euryale.AAC.1
MPVASPRAAAAAAPAPLGPWSHVAVLCWAHAVPGWSFFVLSNWLPAYLTSLGAGSMQAAGLLAALPFVATALAMAGFGAASDAAIARGAPRLAVRRAAHAVSTLGCAAATLPLAALPAISPAAATAAVVGAQVRARSRVKACASGQAVGASTVAVYV